MSTCCKRVAGISLNVAQRVWVAGVSERINIQDRVFRGLNNMPNEIAADEASDLL